MIPKWNKLPKEMQTEKVREYYDLICSKSKSLAAKRAFDIVGSLALIAVLSPVMGGIAIMIKNDSKGPILYRQERVTQYGRKFKVCKFRTMVDDADKIGAHVTVDGDPRITAVGHKLRDHRLDELPQLFNVLAGTMTFVGTRPEAVRYVNCYTDEMNATLLLPAGVTSEASIRFKDEAEILAGEEDIEGAYVAKVLPEKMKYNLEYLKNFSIVGDIGIICKTIGKVFG